MAKKQWNLNILLPTIFVFLIAAMMSTGYAAASPHVHVSSYVEVQADGTVSEFNVVAEEGRIPRYEVSDYVETLKLQEYSGYFTTDLVQTTTTLKGIVKNNKPIPISEMPSMEFISGSGTITFRHYIGDLSSLGGTSSSSYTLKMPGKIVDSNAHEVRDDVAVWYFRNGVSTIRATSDAPGFLNTSGFPFGLLAILLVICAAVGVFLWRRL
jgi:hypothetical protein